MHPKVQKITNKNHEKPSFGFKKKVEICSLGEKAESAASAFSWQVAHRKKSFVSTCLYKPVTFNMISNVNILVKT